MWSLNPRYVYVCGLLTLFFSVCMCVPCGLFVHLDCGGAHATNSPSTVQMGVDNPSTVQMGVDNFFLESRVMLGGEKKKIGAKILW